MTSTSTKSSLERDISSYIGVNPKIISFCFGKKRPIFLTKYIDATKNRIDITRRLRLFSRFVRDIKKLSIDRVCLHNEHEFELIFDGYVAHIREEIIQKDRKLFLISTFEKDTKK